MNEMERYELPDEWRWATVGEIARSIQYGYTAKSSSEFKGPRYLRITDIQDGLVDWENVPRCEIPAEELSKYLLQKGDIVFARSGATAGKSYLITETPQAVFASYLIRVQTNDQVLPGFLYTYFNSKDYWDHLTTRGNAQPNANAQVLGAVRFPLPPLPEQHRIVKKIESLFAEARTARAALERAEPLLKKFRQAVLSAAFRGKLSEGDDNWRRVTLGEVIDSLQYGTSVKANADAQTGIPVLRMGNIQDGKIDFTNLKYIDRTKEDVPKYLMKKGDILINRTNSPELVGKAAMFREEGEYLFASYLIRLCVNPTLILPEYLNGVINSDIGRQHVANVKHQVAGQANINSQNIRDMPIPLPPLAEQQRIVERIESLFAQAEQIERAVKVGRRRAERVEQAVLARAFRGGL